MIRRLLTLMTIIATTSCGGSSPTPAPAAPKQETASASSAAPAPAAPGEGTASITSDPDGAEIFVDSVGRGHAPALLKLKPGKHKIQLVADGYKDWVGEIDVTGSSIVNVTGKWEK